MTNQTPAEALRQLYEILDKYYVLKHSDDLGIEPENEIKDIVTAYAATVEREARRRELKQARAYVDPRYYNERLAALQGPIQGDSNTSEEASSAQ